MWGWVERRAVKLVPLLLATGLTAACAGASVGSDRLPVPTFAAPGPTGPARGAGAGPAGKLPDDCARVLSADDLGALFAMPLGSVSLGTVRGVPEPSVGRTERLSCRYTGNGSPAPLLELNIGRYTDPISASDHWKLNSDAERAAGGVSRDVSIGSAPAVLVERGTETVLTVVYGVDMLTFVLPGNSAGGRPAADALVDLALRALPPITATAPTVPAPMPAPTRTGQEQAAAQRDR